MIQLYKMAFRDLGRHRRRSFLSALALAMGLALLLLLSSVVEGEIKGALETSIKLNSGHLQVRAASYNEDKNHGMFVVAGLSGVRVPVLDYRGEGHMLFAGTVRAVVRVIERHVQRRTAGHGDGRQPDGGDESGCDAAREHEGRILSAVVAEVNPAGR